jgi:hypothetical protein
MHTRLLKTNLLGAHGRRTRVATTCHPAAQALRQPRRAPRVLFSRPQRLYINFVVHPDYSSPGHSGSKSTSSCIPTTRHPAAQALRQPRRAPRVLVSRPQRLYINFAVHADYSSPSRTGSTSTSPCAMSTRLPAATALHQPRRRDVVFRAYDHLD